MHRTSVKQEDIEVILDRWTSQVLYQTLIPVQFQRALLLTLKIILRDTQTFLSQRQHLNLLSKSSVHGKLLSDKKRDRL